jgi:MSHA biogenesis protein MshJ
MKQRLADLAARVDALSLRERAMVFVACAASILFVVHSLMLGPLYKKEAALRAQIGQARNNIAGIDAEITTKVQGFAVDPDAPNRARLEKIMADTAALDASLRTIEQGLVPPERIAPLLENILAANGRLALLYRHGVEVTVRGNYLDMLNYMATLEALPTGLLWGSAELQAEEYPDSRLTLTLYTLSLDRKWMKL